MTSSKVWIWVFEFPNLLVFLKTNFIVLNVWLTSISGSHTAVSHSHFYFSNHCKRFVNYCYFPELWISKLMGLNQYELLRRFSLAEDITAWMCVRAWGLLYQATWQGSLILCKYTQRIHTLSWTVQACVM